MPRFVSIAHRGASGNGHCPENTLSAFDKAIKLGVDCVECDVHCSKDGHVVVIHDSTLNRTTDKKGAVAELTLEEIKQADAGSWFSKSFAGERVPTLEELLSLTKDKVVTVIEIKPKGITESVLKVVERSNAIDRVLIQSFHFEVVKELYELNPKVPRALLVGGGLPISRLSSIMELVHQAAEVGAGTLNLLHTVITANLVKEANKRGISVWAWTVDDESRMVELLDIGVSGITSNFPDKLVRIS